MRARSLRRLPASACCFVLLATTLGCATTAVQSDATLGRIIVYRNGVAYFERSAVLEDDHLRMTVPDGQLDDFLKSLSVKDATTGELAPVSYRTGAAGAVDLDVQLAGPRPHRVTLSYVTEAPAWKPSYRVTLGESGKVKLQAWAIVDNTSGEDWNGVRLGVSSGSALSFRYDLRSVRSVARDRLEPQGLLASAPPNGGPTYGPNAEKAPGSVVLELDDKALAALDGEESKGNDPVQLQTRVERAEQTVKSALERARRERDVVKTLCLNDKLTQLGTVKRSFADHLRRGDGEHGRALLSALAARSDTLLAESNQCVGEEAGFMGSSSVAVTIDTGGAPAENGKPPPASKGPMGGESGPAGPPSAARAPEQVSAAPLAALEQRVAALKEQIHRDKSRVRLLASVSDTTDLEGATRRGELLKARLVRSGIPADRVVVDVRKTDGAPSAISILTEPMALRADKPEEAKRHVAALEPIKSSLFEIARPMDVPRNSSVMLALFSKVTAGEVVYYYDPESPRGDASFPFRAVRLKNPTGSTLESGPVSVVMEGRFLGEGVSDPIPAGSYAFVPFAQDRLIVAERTVSETDAVARIIAARRGVFTTEVKHARTTRIALYNRAETAAKVYLRHTTPSGYVLTRSPAKADRIAGAQLYFVDVPARGKVDVEIVETSSAERATDVRSGEGAKLLAAYVATGEVEPRVREVLGRIVGITSDIAKLEEQLASRREQQKEYRDRLHELHAEVVTLRTVKSSSGLLATLEKKLGESSDRVSKITSEIVALQEQMLVARVRLSDTIADFRLDAGGGAAVADSKALTVRSR